MRILLAKRGPKGLVHFQHLLRSVASADHQMISIDDLREVAVTCQVSMTSEEVMALKQVFGM